MRQNTKAFTLATAGAALLYLSSCHRLPPASARATTGAQATASFWDGWGRARAHVGELGQACRGAPPAQQIFCAEGFFYGHHQALEKRVQLEWAALPEERLPQYPPYVDRQVRALWLTALGLVLAENGLALPSPQRAGRLLPHVADGWGFRKYQHLGAEASAKECGALATPELRQACNFGRGRASYFDANAEEPAGEIPRAGWAFAKGFTAGGVVEPAASAPPGERLGYYLLRLWMGPPVENPAIKPLYACLGPQHPAACLAQVP